MGEEVKIADYQGGGGDDERVAEWEFGLPTADDLTPLSQPLIPPVLATAFSISPEPYRTLVEVNRASHDTISAIRGGSQALSSNNFPDEEEGDREDSRKLRKIDGGGAEEADSAAEDPSARSLKRPRLVWTPQLHKRFVDVVAHLGIKNAVPKTIMQLMNVEGLTRENVASHLQKYRLYLKRMQGLSTEGPSSSDHLFASTPVPQSLHESIPMPYPPPPMMPMAVLGFNPLQHQRDWSSTPPNKYASGFSYPHHTLSHSLTPNDK